MSERIMDLRRSKEYQSDVVRDEFSRWEEHNIFYNTLFFECRVKGPDVEFSNAAIDHYKKQENAPYKNWKTRKDGTKVKLQSETCGKISADLMTGWWNPTKHFLRQEGSRKQIALALFRFCEKYKNCNDDEMAQKLGEEYKRSKEACRSMLEFLKVVYTPGNMIPIACSYPAGRSLDGWDMKLLHLCDENCKSITIEKWRKYIENEFGSFDAFIEQNSLECFFVNGKASEGVELYWNRVDKYQDAEDEEWNAYFDNAVGKIISRNMKI